MSYTSIQMFVDPIITRISFILAVIFYLPVRLWTSFCLIIAKILLKYSKNKYNYYGGYSAQIGLKLIANASKVIEEVSIDTIKYTTQITEKEEIMKAIRSDRAYPYVPKDDKELKPEDQTTFKIQYLDPFVAAKLGDQIFDVKGAGSSRKERFLTGTQQLSILKQCLKGWENFVHPDSTKENPQLLEFDSNNITEMIASIPPNVRAELADFARGESELDEGES